MKRKQIIVLGLVLVIIAVGILQYNSGGAGEYQKITEANVTDTSTVDGGIQPEDIPGAAVYVNSEQSDQTVATTGNASQNGTAGYFAQARLDRDKARSKQKEELTSLSESGDPANPATLQAQEDLVNVINRCEVETTVESLIKQRDFDDVLVYMSDTGNIDVMVNASSLSAQQVAQISDIVTRHADVPMENITVKNVN